jgi:hypothetical protein
MDSKLNYTVNGAIVGVIKSDADGSRERAIAGRDRKRR